MTSFAFALVPLWALSLVVGFTALRMARRLGAGLVLLCFATAIWVSGLILLLTPGAAPWAERALPSGMLLAGAFVHAGANLSGERHPRAVAFAWATSVAVSLAGFLWPRALYGPGAVGPGPLFLPLAVASVLATLWMKAWLISLLRAAPRGLGRGRLVALLIGNFTGALGGGGAIALHVYGLAPVGVAAPFLFLSLAMAAWAVWRGEDAKGKALLSQGFASAVVAAALAAPGLVVFAHLAPTLLPGELLLTGTGAALVFLFVLPLDPLRLWVVEAVVERALHRPLAARTMVAALERQETRAEHAERLAEVGRVAGAVAHEVRNPLGVILAEAKLLEQEGASPESLAAIRAQVQRASRFVDELLRYAQPRALETSALDAVAVVTAAARAAAKAHGAEERLTLEAPATAPLEADAHALEDVTTNLVSNALIATSAASGRVTVRLREEGDALWLEVQDDGPGVPEAVRARLFEPFVTGRGRDAAHPGTGLGLALSKRLAERHGAHITHARPEGGGARFVVRWPKVPPADSST